jgi:hypothetical protein
MGEFSLPSGSTGRFLFLSSGDWAAWADWAA